MKGKLLKTKRLFALVVTNPDGAITIYDDVLQPYENQALLIASLGGVQAVIDRCTEELTDDQFMDRVMQRTTRLKQQAKSVKQRAQEREQKRDEEFIEAFKQLPQPIAPTLDNLRTILGYIRATHGNDLPRLTIGYTTDTYDCDGTIAQAIVLDEPIEVDGEKCRRFVLGAPRGHLSKYRRL